MAPTELAEPIVIDNAWVAAGGTPQEVVRRAKVFAEHHDQSKLIPLLGTSDGFMTPEELDAMRADEE